MIKKIGRNDPCPCASGRKFKKCCGSIAALEGTRQQTKQAMEFHRQFIEAMVLQRRNQQGLGAPIISTEIKGTRFVAVRNRLFHSKTWKTFYGFLSDYIKMAIGSNWGNAELKKPLQERHPILQWYDKVSHLQRKHFRNDGKVYSAPMTGGAAAYYSLAYDLYCLDHNAELQQKLINRLKSNDNFYGARYEVLVAAILIRAGFEIQFEDENKRGSTHCEFTATSRRTGKQYSVECKHRDSGSKSGTIKLSKLGRTLRSALTKQANHERIVFIDLNFPYDPKKCSTYPPQMELALRHIQKFETNKSNGKCLPPAFVFMTNYPAHHHLDDENVGFAVTMEGFKIPEYKTDRPYSLREAIANREKHKDIHHLLTSMEKYSTIPATFDGEIPEFAFGKATNRLLIGHHYLIKDPDGHARVGLLTSATVNESEKTAYCGLTYETGESVVATWPLSDIEMAAYRAHPDTFFGQVSRSRKVDSPLEMYDAFLETYSKTPKERLLEFMANAPNIGHLKTLSQGELAVIYIEGLVNHAMARMHRQAGTAPAQV